MIRDINTDCEVSDIGLITRSAVAQHCCNGHLKINKKMGNSTPCRIATRQNFILKFTSGTSPTCKFWGRLARQGVLPKYVKYNTFVTFLTVFI